MVWLPFSYSEWKANNSVNFKGYAGFFMFSANCLMITTDNTLNM